MKIKCVTGNRPDGQKICSARMEYDTALDPFSVGPDSFSVENRNITGVSVDGNTVLLDLDIFDPAASVIPRPERGPGGPGGPGGKPGGNHKGPPPHLPKMTRVEPSVRVKQTGDIRAADGSVLGAWTDYILSGEAEEPVVGAFRQFEHKGMLYNLFMPDNPRGEKLPLVFFLHDAMPCGDDPKLTLSQGNGAVTWAKPEWQRRHPCYVLAPQVRRGEPLTNDDFEVTAEFELLKEIIDHVAEHYDVDRKRIYATGQSMGCMASCELNIRWPDFFAASMLVAGQWSPERMADKCANGKFWILVAQNDAKAFPGMNAVTAAMEEKGAKVRRMLWNAKADSAQLDALCASASAGEENILYTVFQGDSVIPPWRDKNPGANHVCTWPVAYEIEGVKEWLFAQHL